ncbi:MAG: hypothetical protein KAZ18_03000 [Acinetobacter sp.]|nr:hypothetical protein [Acinetobacter sp.]
MFKEILDWITLIAGIFAIAASIATIFAVSIAIKALDSWKNENNFQQIQEFQTTFYQLKMELEENLLKYYLYRSSVIANKENKSYLDDYNSTNLELNKLLRQYELKGNLLKKNIASDLDDYLPDPAHFSVLIHGANKNNMERITDSDELFHMYYSNIVPKNERMFKKGNDYLENLQKKI